ncbi:protein spinster-like [Daphnia pulicaria]|uniref:protein spinster-like n=1 Tax=Daphnia pulicaria TaxID=35523 RepID=UPI001EE9ECFA|nr:protein spinster-like [Daphnia pulicaria]
MKTEEADQTPPYDSSDHLKISVAEKTNPPILSTFTAESDSGAIKQDAAAEEPASQMTRGKMINTLIICLLQLLNFMDRYALPGILPVIIDELDLSNLQGGLLQSAFIVSYVVVAPLVGYLGDRFSRKIILIVGLTVWSLVSLAGSYMTTYSSLLALRCLGGIGEATYSAIGPAMIADMFVGDTRSNMLAMFYFMMLVGGGLGYITGSGVAAATGSWNWGLRVTPILSLISVFLIIFFLKEPARGESEGSRLVSTSWKKDIIYLLHNRSFMFSTTASVALVFVIGAVGVWAPQFVVLSRKVVLDETHTFEEISLVYGVISIVSGITAVIVGAIMGMKLRSKYPSADALICGVGMLLSAPFFYGFLVAGTEPLYWIYILSFIALWFINLNWALVGDILLYVVVPTRRATAETFQIMSVHVFGDASSPFIIGLISDAFEPLINSDSEDYRKYTSLQYALLINPFIQILSAALFMAGSFYLLSDRDKAKRAVADGIARENASN